MLSQDQNLFQALNELYDGTEMFNSIAGQLHSLTQIDLDRQSQLVLDEAEELKDSGTDKVNALKEAIDVLVTAFGYIQKLGMAYDCDIAEAMNLVNGNNLSKFSEDSEDLMESIRFYMDKGVKVDVHYDQDSGLYSLKDESGKVRKPVWYKACDLSSCFETLQ
jgi:hypothetical protein